MNILKNSWEKECPKSPTGKHQIAKMVLSTGKDYRFCPHCKGFNKQWVKQFVEILPKQ